jgi:hypothetical protein
MSSDTLMLAVIERLNSASIDIPNVYKYHEVGEDGLKG